MVCDDPTCGNRTRTARWVYVVVVVYTQAVKEESCLRWVPLHWPTRTINDQFIIQYSDALLYDHLQYYSFFFRLRRWGSLFKYFYADWYDSRSISNFSSPFNAPLSVSCMPCQWHVSCWWSCSYELHAEFVLLLSESEVHGYLMACACSGRWCHTAYKHCFVLFILDTGAWAPINIRVLLYTL